MYKKAGYVRTGPKESYTRGSVLKAKGYPKFLMHEVLKGEIV